MAKKAVKLDQTKLASTTRDRLLAAVDAGRIHRPRTYQAKRLASQARFNLDLWSRQTGKSDTNAADAVLLCAATNENVMLLSASQDLTREAMVKVALYAEVLHGVAGDVQVAVLKGELDEDMYVDDSGVKITQTIITMPNGRRIVGRPANPRTARGFSAHVKLDEFGMHRDQDEIYAAAFPSVTSRPNLRLSVMSTPGLSSTDKFSDLCRAAIAGESDFEFSKVTIHDAIAAGHPADAEQLRRNLRDEERWRREYLCEFVDEAGAYLTLDLIRGCEHEGIRCDLPTDPRTWSEQLLGWNPAAGRLFLGGDIGRRHDLSVFWLLQELGDVLWTRAMISMRGMPFREQFAVVSQIFENLPIYRSAIDETGIGMQFVEDLQVRFGDRVEGLTYTNKLKAELAPAVRRRFEDRLVRIPISVPIRDALHSVRKSVTAAGNIRFAGERTVDGHADEFWALANAIHATDSGVTAGVVLL